MNKFEDARSTGQKEENIMGKYEQDARLLLAYVGGKENIAAVSHCVSRMRFVLNDPAKADVAKIEALKSAKGTFTQAGQFQVIIGNTVNDFYNDFIAVSGIDGVSKEAVKSAAKQNQNALQKVMSVLAEIFAPLIPAIITGGLILGFRNCIDSIYFFNNGTQTLCDISQFWSGVDSFLWLIGEAVFHMLPVCICWSVTKKMGTTQSLGIVLGLTLVSGQLLNAYSVASTAAADIPKWDFGFFTINMIGYQAQVIPAMLAAFTLVYLEKFFRKICPAVIVAVHDGDRLLLTRYRGRPFKKYALIAGFNEIGETIEQTVHREVLEEAGVRVKNLRFYKSQPWVFTDSLLMGFFAQLDGSDEITVEEDELSEARWFRREELPADHSAISLTGEMIEYFRSHKL